MEAPFTEDEIFAIGFGVNSPGAQESAGTVIGKGSLSTVIANVLEAAVHTV